MHDQERDRAVLAAHVHRIVVRTADSSSCGENMRQVASHDGRHTATVGVAGGVDAATVNAVGTVDLIDDLQDELQVRSTLHYCVRGTLPAVLDGLREDLDGLLASTSDRATELLQSAERKTRRN